MAITGEITLLLEGAPLTREDLRQLPTGAATQTTLAAALTQLQTIAAAVADLDGNTDGIETKLDQVHTDLVALQGFVDGIETLLGRLPSTGAASETTLAAIQGLIGTAVSDSVLSVLRTIATNTNTAAVDVAELNLTADQVQLNTDAVEAKLDTVHADLVSVLGAVDGLEGFTDGIEGALATLNAKDFATQTTLAAIQALLPASLSGGRLKTEVTQAAGSLFLVDGSAHTQPVSGTVSVDNLPNTVTLNGQVDTELAAAILAADAMALPTVPQVIGVNARYNGATLDLERGNVELTLLASAARTAISSSGDITNHNARGIVVYLNVTAASGTGGLQVQIEEKDPVSGAYNQVNSAPTAVTSNGNRAYKLYPGVNATNASSGLAQAVSQPLPRTFRVRVAHADSSSYTYSLGAVLLA